MECSTISAWGAPASSTPPPMFPEPTSRVAKEFLGAAGIDGSTLQRLLCTIRHHDVFGSMEVLQLWFWCSFSFFSIYYLISFLFQSRAYSFSIPFGVSAKLCMVLLYCSSRIWIIYDPRSLLESIHLLLKLSSDNLCALSWWTLFEWQKLVLTHGLMGVDVELNLYHTMFMSRLASISFCPRRQPWWHEVGVGNTRKKGRLGIESWQELTCGVYLSGWTKNFG